MIRRWLDRLSSWFSKVRAEARELPSRWPAVLLFVACLLLVLLARGSWGDGAGRGFRFSQISGPGAILDWLVTLPWALAFLVTAPFFLSVIASQKLTDLWSQGKDDFELEVGPLPLSPEKPKAGSGDPERDARRWDRIKDAVEMTWGYERKRHLDALKRLRLNALVFGDIATVALTCCVLVFKLGSGEGWGKELGSETVRSLMTSIAAASATAFFVKFGRLMVRISSGDVSSRMFAWATRSLTLVVIADVGLFFALEGQVTTGNRAIVLGLFAGATGDHAIQLLLEKAAALFKTTSPPPIGPSPLLSIEGMTAEHVDRLEEEGILSLHDLAFVPTARLFFLTEYSLQQICNWQDRALLCVYVGVPGAKALEQHMKILGAIDLRACAHRILYEATSADREEVKKALGNALSLAEGGLPELLDSMAHDEVTMRLRLYWQSAVTSAAEGSRLEAGRSWVLETAEVVITEPEDEASPGLPH